MPSDAVKFTLRTEPELLKKFRFVAEYNARSANRELEVLMKKHIADFEKAHGKIEIDITSFILTRKRRLPYINSNLLFSLMKYSILKYRFLPKS